MNEDPAVPYKVYIHFDFDNFDADLMADMRDKNAKNLHGLYRLSRMIPQGYFHYFFTYVYENEEDPTKNQIFTFIDDTKEVMDVNGYDQRAISVHFDGLNRYGFKLENIIE